MSRFTILATLIIGALLGLACSGGGTPTTPDPSQDLTKLEAGNPENHVVWGAFDLELNLDEGTAEIVNGRNADIHVDLTNFLTAPGCYTCFTVLATFYDQPGQTFWVELALTNPFPITGYDLRLVISNPGGNKFVLNPDGLTTVWGTPMQYKAFNPYGNRAFEGYSSHGQTFAFYLPAPEGFATLSFIIDAAWPVNVEEPLLENGISEPVINNGFSTTNIVTTIIDHQGDLNVQTVMADLQPLGGHPQTTMYDDGAHNDGAPGDGKFGSDIFSTTAAVGVYMMNVYAFDMVGNMGWGQVPVHVLETVIGPNDDPVIQSITSDKTTAKGGGSDNIKITVEASDPDGDPIGYDYSATSGSFSGQNNNFVYWKPSSSKTGKQTITVTVLDDKGGEATGTIDLWSTTYATIKGPIPSGTVTSVIPSATLHMGEDFMGMCLYINVWATWCPPCKAELPHLTSMYKKYKSNPDFTFIEISVGESASTVTNFLSSYNYECTYWAIDPSNIYFYKVHTYVNNNTGIPQHYIFDRDGNCRFATVGGMSNTSALEAVIDQLL